MELEIFYFGQNNESNTFFDIYGRGIPPWQDGGETGQTVWTFRQMNFLFLRRFSIHGFQTTRYHLLRFQIGKII